MNTNAFTFKKIFAAILIGMTASSAVIPTMTAAPVSCPIETSAASWESLKQTDSHSYNNNRITNNDAKSTLRNIGCAMYSVYYSVMDAGLRDSSYTPGNCLSDLKAVGAFNANSCIKWATVHKAFPELTYTDNINTANMKRSNAIKKAGSLFNEGYAVIVGVATNGSKNTNHWVYVKGYNAKNGSLSILDSGGTNQKNITVNGSYSLNKIITYKVKPKNDPKSDAPKAGKTYVIYSCADPSRALTATGTKNQSNVELRKADGSTSQKWKVVDAGNGRFKLQNLASNKMLDICANSTSSYKNQINCQIFAPQSNSAYSKTQMVSFTKINNAYRIITYNTSYCIDCAGTEAQIRSGKTSNAQIYAVTGGASNTTQLFIFKAV